MKILLFFFCLFVFTAPALARDVLTLDNGRQLTGEILSHNAQIVNMRTADGSYRIPMTQISDVVSDNPRLQRRMDHMRDLVAYDYDDAEDAANVVEQYRKSEYRPSPPSLIQNSEAVMDTKTVASTSNPKTVEVKPNKTSLAPPSSIETSEKFLGAEWSGNINIGAGLRTGNSETNNINADTTLEAKWNKQHRSSFEADYNREEEDSEVSVDDRSAGLKHDYFFAEKWFLQGAAQFEQDDIAQLDLRTLLSAGLGYQPYDRDDLSLQFVAGPGYQNEEFENGTEDKSMTAQWSLDYKQKFYDDLFRLFHNHDISAPTEDFEAWLFQSKSGIRVPLRQGIVASGQVDFDWDNDPPTGTKEDDTTYTAKLGYEW